MKPELSELRKWLQTLLKKQNRARLALVLGCIAMALILLSELFPAKAPAAPQGYQQAPAQYAPQQAPMPPAQESLYDGDIPF